MVKKYRAYNKLSNKHEHFKIIATDESWVLHHPEGQFGDYSKTSQEENFNVAYTNMLKVVEQRQLTDLTEIN